MKAQILKIAGVKNEKEFYKKFPTEEAFLKKHGKELKKAQVGTSIDAATTKPVKPINFGDIYAEAEANNMGISLEEKKRQEALAAQKASSKGAGDSGMAGLVGGAMKALGGSNGDIIGNVAGMFERGGYLPMAQDGGFLKSLPIQGLSDSAKALPTLTSPISADTNTFNAASLKDTGNALLSQAGSIIGNIQAIGEMQHQQDQQKQFAKISDVTAQAAESQDVDAKRQKRYVRPEDMAFQPGQMGNPYGSGTNYLQARNGAEIQNTYAPSNLYMDLGYEPLNDSNVKQFQFGGIASGIGSWVTGGGFQDSPEGQIGSVAGKTIGALIPIPGASQVLEGVGGLVGGLFGGARQNETNNYAEQGKQNTMRAAGANFGKATRSQFSGSLEDGGWVSNDWQPQVIAKFGEYDVKDLLKPPHDADMLRAGGHLKEYTPPSARAMFTGRMDDGGVMHSTNMMFDTDRFPRAEYGTQMAMGGDLQVHRGKAETMSYNPYLPDGGETVMFRGPSHDNGGMPITFGENGVEVEGGEPAVKLQDGGSPDGNLVVFGDMYMPGQKQKFKHYAADLSKIEAKQNKLVDKSTKLINNLDVNTEFDKLSLQAANANIIGANMKLRDIAKQKTEAAALQNAILDTASEQGLVAADLAKGKIVKDKEAMKKAKYGAKMTTAQAGMSVDPNDAWINKILDYEYKSGSPTGTGLSDWGYHTRGPKTKQEALDYFKQDYVPKVDYLPLGLRERAADWMFNTGKDPRIPMLMAAGKIKSNAFGLAGPRVELAQDPAALDELWNKHSDEITGKAKDPEFLKKFDTARKVMYQNINKGPQGGINPAYDATWKGRTNIFNEDDIPVPASATAPIVPIVPMGMNAPSSARFQRDGIASTNMDYPQAPIDARVMFAPDAYSPIDMSGGMPPFTPYDGTYVQQKDVPPVFNEDTAAAALKGKKKGKGFNWKDASLFAQSVMPFIRPSNQEPLDPAQLSGEMFALSQNQLEPVQAQLYTPQLGTPYDISLQDQLNANQADFNAMQRQLGGNPEALAALAAQKYGANAQVLGSQFRANQAEKARVYEANRQTMNEAQRANLGILDQQFQRQAMAKSKTKQEAETALQSIASKIAQHNLANRTLGVYENMYNYRYAPGGQAYNLNAPYSWNIPTVGSGAKTTSDIALTEAERLQALADAQKIKEANAKAKKGRNGAIVKAIKGL